MTDLSQTASRTTVTERHEESSRSVTNAVTENRHAAIEDVDLDLDSLSFNALGEHHYRQFQDLLARTRYFLKADFQEKAHVNFAQSRESFMKSLAALGIGWDIGGRLWQQIVRDITRKES